MNPDAPTSSPTIATSWCRNLLEEARLEGFHVDIRTHLMVERFLMLRGQELSERECRDAIIAMVAKSGEEQARLRDIYEAHMDRVARIREMVVVDPTPNTGRNRVSAVNRARTSVRRNAIGLLIAAVIAVFIATGVALLLEPPPKPVENSPEVPDSLTGRVPNEVASVTGRVGLATMLPPTSRLVIVDDITRPWVWWGFALVPLLWAVLNVLRYRPLFVVRRPPRPISRKGPFRLVLPELPAGARLTASEATRLNSSWLRRRTRGGAEAFEVEPSILATIAAADSPTPIIRQQARTPEYLALVRHESRDDHWAKAMESLVALAKSDGVSVSCYLYRTDPRVCHETLTDRSQTLEQLRALGPSHRLILFTDGNELIDPVTGEWAPWTDMLEEWAERAIVTPLPRQQRGPREELLDERFVVVPAGRESLRQLVDLWANPGLEPNAGDVGFRIGSPDEVPAETCERLKAQLSSVEFDWLTACAVFSEIRWEVTLRLGQLDELGKPGNHEDHVLALARLPWFRAGVWPAGLREELLKRIDPGVEAAARRLVHDLLARFAVAEDGPGLESMARANLDRHLIEQELLLPRDTNGEPLPEAPEPRKAYGDELVRRVFDHLSPEEVRADAILLAGFRERTGGLTPLRARAWRKAASEFLQFNRREWAKLVFGIVCLAAIAAVPNVIPRIAGSPIHPSLSRIAMPVGTRFAPIVRDDSLRVLSSAGLTWTSHSPSVASVDDSGRVWAKSPGHAEITAATGWQRVVFDVTVDSTADGFEAWSVPYYVAVDSLVRMGSILSRPGGGAPDSMNWASWDPSIVSVDDNVLQGLRPGTAVVTAESRFGTQHYLVLVPSQPDRTTAIAEMPIPASLARHYWRNWEGGLIDQWFRDSTVVAGPFDIDWTIAGTPGPPGIRKPLFPDIASREARTGISPRLRVQVVADVGFSRELSYPAGLRRDRRLLLPEGWLEVRAIDQQTTSPGSVSAVVDSPTVVPTTPRDTVRLRLYARSQGVFVGDSFSVRLGLTRGKTETTLLARTAQFETTPFGLLELIGPGRFRASKAGTALIRIRVQDPETGVTLSARNNVRVRPQPTPPLLVPTQSAVPNSATPVSASPDTNENRSANDNAPNGDASILNPSDRCGPIKLTSRAQVLVGESILAARLLSESSFPVGKDLRWSVTDAAIVVFKDGVLTGRRVGVTLLRAQCGKYEASVEIQVLASRAAQSK